MERIPQRELKRNILPKKMADLFWPAILFFTLVYPSNQSFSKALCVPYIRFYDMYLGSFSVVFSAKILQNLRKSRFFGVHKCI